MKQTPNSTLVWQPECHLFEKMEVCDALHLQVEDTCVDTEMDGPLVFNTN